MDSSFIVPFCTTTFISYLFSSHTAYKSTILSFSVVKFIISSSSLYFTSPFGVVLHPLKVLPVFVNTFFVNLPVVPVAKLEFVIVPVPPFALYLTWYGILFSTHTAYKLTTPLYTFVRLDTSSSSLYTISLLLFDVDHPTKK